MKKFLLIIILSISLVMVGCFTADVQIDETEAAEPINEPEAQTDAETVTDYDGNIYSTIKIGDQVWMAENLKTTHYSDGSPVDYFPVENMEPNDKNGLLYSSDSVYNGETNETIKGLAPDGWHIPSEAEWQTLIDYLGGENEAGAMMKSSKLWNEKNLDFSDESGFGALPVGMYDFTNVYQWQENTAVFMTSTHSSKGVVMYRIELNGKKIIKGIFHPDDAVSVRCIKDN